MQSLGNSSLTSMGENLTCNISRHSLICADSGALICAAPPPKSICVTITAYSPGLVHEHNAFMTGSMAVDIIVAGMRMTDPTSCGGKNSGQAPPINGIRRATTIATGAAATVSVILRGTLVRGTLLRVETQPTSNVFATSAAMEVRIAAKTVGEGKSSQKTAN